MRKHTKALKCLWVGLFSVAVSLPVNAAPATPSISVPATNGQVGVVAAVRGIVKVDRSGGPVGEVLQSGKPVFLGDLISTDASGNLQVLLLDQTIFTIGPNSAMTIDKFVYDPANQTGKVEAKIVKGVFRFVSGRIAQKNPSDMQVDLPNGTIGIRGTIVAGSVDNSKSLVMLLGPGKNHNTGHKEGKFILSGNNVSQEVNRSGYGCEIDGQGPPTPPFEVPKNIVEQISNTLGGPVNFDSNNPPSGTGGGDNQPGRDGQSSTEKSGQEKAQGGTFIRNQRDINKVFQKLQQVDDKAGQDVARGERLLDGIAKFEDLRKINNGFAHFNQLNVPFRDRTTQNLLTPGQNFYSVYYEINFGARQIGTGNTRVTGKVANNTFEYNNSTQQFVKDFSNLSGPAGAHYAGLIESGACSANCSNPVLDITFGNQDGVVAKNLIHRFQIDSTVGPTDAEGSGVTQGQPGPTP